MYSEQLLQVKFPSSAKCVFSVSGEVLDIDNNPRRETFEFGGIFQLTVTPSLGTYNEPSRVNEGPTPSQLNQS